MGTFKKLLSTIILATLVATSPKSFAIDLLDFSVISFGVTPIGQFPSTEGTVAGLRFCTIFCWHKNVFGFDIGLIGNYAENFGGLSFAGAVNYVKAKSYVTGLQLAGVSNINMGKARIFGAQLATIINSNQGDAITVGLQLALANLGDKQKVIGVQAGLYNQAQSISGLQIGIVNKTKNLHGIQIGLMNFASDSFIKVFPVFNIGF